MDPPPPTPGSSKDEPTAGDKRKCVYDEKDVSKATKYRKRREANAAVLEQQQIELEAVG